MKSKSNGLKRGEPLPRGRHGLGAKAVRASQRERLIEAMQTLVATQGYAATTVPQVVSAARVSRNAFYEFFKDKQDCFLAMSTDYGPSLHAAAMGHVNDGNWEAALRGGLHDYLLWWQLRPEFARAYFVETPVVGAHALAERDKAYKPFESMFAQLGQLMRLQNRSLPPLPHRAPRMLVLAVMELLADEVRSGRERQLTQIEDDLLFLITRLLGGELKGHTASPAKSAEAALL